jgi:hypothetical protein
MANTKPFVAVACVCEKVLVEADNVVSLVRIVDTFALQIPDEHHEASPGPPAVFAFTAFASLKSGDVTGKHEVSLVLRRPGGAQEEPISWPVVLTGGEQGVNLTVSFGIAGKAGAPPELGLYWIDLLWRNEVLTSIPLRLTRAPQPMPTSREPVPRSEQP